MQKPPGEPQQPGREKKLPESERPSKMSLFEHLGRLAHFFRFGTDFSFSGHGYLSIIMTCNPGKVGNVFLSGPIRRNHPDKQVPGFRYPGHPPEVDDRRHSFPERKTYQCRRALPSGQRKKSPNRFGHNLPDAPYFKRKRSCRRAPVQR